MALGNQYACKYDEIQKDEVKFLFDVLHDKSITNIANETGYSRWFVSNTLDKYINKNKL